MFTKWFNLYHEPVKMSKNDWCTSKNCGQPQSKHQKCFHQPINIDPLNAKEKQRWKIPSACYTQASIFLSYISISFLNEGMTLLSGVRF